MKTTMKVLLIAAVVLVGAGVIGLVVFNGIGAAADNAAYNDSYRQSYLSAYNDSYGRGMMGGWLDNDDDDYDAYCDYYEEATGYYGRGMMGEWLDNDDDDVSYYGRGMMGRWLDNDADDYDAYCDYYEDAIGYYGRGMMFDTDENAANDTAQKLSLEVLEQNVNDYIGLYDEKLAISDIFVFEDSDYYFSIVEEDTGLGAFELLANPYTGEVYPEFGPNMMWNLKYGMHASSEYGIMNGRGMMGRYSTSALYTDENGAVVRNELTLSEAADKANEYLQNSSLSGYTVSEEGHEFYGYYTFHTQLNGVDNGMLSVNGFTGVVWYHDWHGVLSQVIGRH